MQISKPIVSLVLSVTLFAQVSWGQIASTELILGAPSAVSSQDKVSQFVARDDVADAFEKLGVDPKMIELKVASLSDEEASTIASKIDTLPAGGDGGSIIGAIVFIFVVLLITDILGLTKVFNFTRSVR
ncbi:MAG: hypothetical protein JU82_01165 [Sulfuricurvum sp. MLSB]|uniref:PA2779 family protein n=1 Tax=unclassified Sulfuricurvum TaxID=2632390 RepID=UPI000502FF4E|nr:MULTISPECIES: PA2779 family protein [unclassified Sulfuricurvum]KFN40752.1 MAG: hypothetical protein JU82_01165 [Sulfuricurvum sp. MLSB]